MELEPRAGKGASHRATHPLSPAPRQRRLRWRLRLEHEQRERPREDGGPGPRVLGRGGRGGPEVGRHREDAVGGFVELHGAGATAGRDGGDDPELVGGVFVHDRERAVAIRGEGQLGARVCPIGSVVINLPAVASEMAITPLRQPLNRR